MFWLIFYLLLALMISFFCSILEAVILSVTPSYVEALEQKSPAIGAKLRQLKLNVDRPLAGILSLNTIAHTVGAAGVGAQSLVVFGSAYVALSSAILTFLILILSEILPKTLGVLYWKRLTPMAVRVLPVLIGSVYPLVILSQKITGWLSSGKRVPVVSREELQAMTDLARKLGLFSKQESRILKNLLWVGKLKVRDVMTPRPVLFTLPADMTVGEVMSRYPKIRFSRIPIYDTGPENIHSFVLTNDIILEASRDRPNAILAPLGRCIKIVPEMMPLILILEQFLSESESVAMVVNEYGGIEGIVTMEDVVETFLGIEIVDERDVDSDMQAVARRQWTKRARALGIIPSEEDPSGSSPPGKAEAGP
ncbi:MAG: magnesium and cobalt exporter, family [Thermodesulfobacteriota bacterium]|nr:magnesium and cobalt exporter, family [Thermodesulfobacteriota bacterium]